MSRHSPYMLGLALLLTVALYWPALGGGFLFDDFPNIVNNPGVQVHDLHAANWWRAAHASPASALPRPLAMLSFAANEYFTGNDPLPMKAVNVCVHLLNGLLLWLTLRSLLSLYARGNTAWGETQAQWTALAVTVLWLWLPINLTGVVYVVQRMESLAQACVLLGLWQYLEARRAQLAGQGGWLWIVLALVGCSALGFGFKETAVMLPLYAFLAECTVLRFAGATPAVRKGLWWLYALVLFVPMLAVLVHVLPVVLAPGAFDGRPFTLPERLLTEARVLWDYVLWTLLPTPSALGFFHDDVVLSTGWLAPTTTLWAVAGWLCAAALVVLSARRAPLIALGIAWFLAAHLLTATVIPLELVFEHRNYFASIGLLLVCIGVLDALDVRPSLQAVLAMAALLTYGSITLSRAVDWGNPLRFAEAEARHHPKSARSVYEYGRMLVVVSRYEADSPLIPKAYATLNQAARIPGASALPDSALIMLDGHLHRDTAPDVWPRIQAHLAAEPPSEEDISALKAIVTCQQDGSCKPTPDELLAAFLAALQHEPAKPRLLAVYADYVANQLGDAATAVKALQDAVKADGRQVGYRIELCNMLQRAGERDEAQKQIDILKTLPLDAVEQGQLQQLIQNAQGDAPAAAQSSEN